MPALENMFEKKNRFEEQELILHQIEMLHMLTTKDSESMIRELGLKKGISPKNS